MNPPVIKNLKTTDLAKPKVTPLITAFGTVLYVDPKTFELRHGPKDSSPGNALLVTDDCTSGGSQSVWLMHDAAGQLQPIVCSVENSYSLAHGNVRNDPPTPTKFRLIQLGLGVVGLKSGDLYLCAESDTRITLSRRVCSVWECFAPSPDWCETITDADATQLLPPDIVSIDRQAIRSFRVSTKQPPKLQRDEKASVSPSTERRFALRRVIVIRHRGNLANKMLQYMGALTLASRIKDCTIVNVSIPEWRIEIPDDTQDQLFFDNVDLWTWDAFRPHVEELCTMANRSHSIRIMLADHLQRMEFLMPPQFYNSVLPKRSSVSHQMTENDILINIRTAEILDGVPHYPLVPIAFYQDVVARTGLAPVFAGQLTESEYVRQLRLCFPGAKFLDSVGAIADFDLIRSAKNIVVAVSTFSWLAAWLSEAKTIILPLSGFYNPAQHREIDLLPVDDIRYRYFLFPLNFGVPEQEALQHHERIKGRWKEISRNQVALLKSASPFLRVPRENYNSGLPLRSAQGAAIAFDPVWYAHQYLDAAMEISEGWFEDPLHHYLEVGRLRGYLATRPIRDELPVDATLRNIAFNKRATQSSLSQWSHGSTLEEDAGCAVNGHPEKDYAFHTENEPNPWWMVDLGSTAQVSLIRIYNREYVPDWIQRRASPLVVEISNDSEQWKPLFRSRPGQLFGGYSSGRPLVWSAKEPVEARFVRIIIPRRETLHLAEVEIYGRMVSEPIEASL